HAVAYVGLLVVLVGPWRALMVIVIHKCVGGFYLASVFAPNHKGMPQVESGESLDFLRAQVLTARNVRSHPLTDLLYGSLNYQSGGNLVIEAAVPGAGPDDVDIQCAEGVLTIRARTEVPDHEFLHQEIRPVEYVRQLALPADCCFDEAKAEADNGILTIRIPK